MLLKPENIPQINKQITRAHSRIGKHHKDYINFKLMYRFNVTPFKSYKDDVYVHTYTPTRS